MRRLACALALWLLAGATPDGAARGRYLVLRVAMCVQCHSPRDARGDLDGTRLLSGARIPLAPSYAEGGWAARAPALAGLPGLADADVAHLLQTGRRLDGSSPRPPMPPFRMSHEDAEAVVTYLRSLAP